MPGRAGTNPGLESLQGLPNFAPKAVGSQQVGHVGHHVHQEPATSGLAARGQGYRGHPPLQQLAHPLGRYVTGVVLRERGWVCGLVCEHEKTRYDSRK